MSEDEKRAFERAFELLEGYSGTSAKAPVDYIVIRTTPGAEEEEDFTFTANCSEKLMRETAVCAVYLVMNSDPQFIHRLPILLLERKIRELKEEGSPLAELGEILMKAM